jgi:hypothetical protein
MAKAKPHPDYDVSDNTYNLKRQNLKDKGWDTEIGDRRTSNKFIPRVKIQRWDDAFIEIGIHPSLQGGGDTVTHDGDAIVWSKGIYTAKFYDMIDDPDDEEGNGSFEWEFILASAPPVNNFSVDIRSENVRFYYQPALTAQEIADGDERPDRVVGSYAVYHTSKRDRKPGEPNYEVGKIGHLYRPLAIDNNGDEIWGSWNDDTEATGQLTLTVDAAWLAAAAYPVTIDPTFGYFDIGGSNYDVSNGTAVSARKAAQQYTASAGDTVTEIAVYGRRSQPTDADMAVAIYDTSSNIPNNRVAVQSIITFTINATYNWVSATGLSISLSGSTNYTTALVKNTENIIMKYDTGAGDDASGDDVSGDAGNLQDPWVENTTQDRLHSIYATYTEGTPSTRRVMVVS